ncbi:MULTISPECIES: FadR/GntR family transcriptional regulator [Falsihalocynthiibacter]|uniref:FadR/GntR family transcriptional regulator n=1 Tax=Falsihalocynthiibacter TaxID=2854182 RepID=UPI0030039FD3
MGVTVLPDQTQQSKRDRAQQVAQALDLLEAGNSKRDVLDALSLMIERAGLGIGDSLPPEVQIAQKLGVGRAKVREALTAWQNMGIVTRNKKAGTRLAAEVWSNSIHMPVTLKLEAESLLRTHSVRRPLEIETSRLAARYANDEQKREIYRRVLELMRIYDAGGDWRAADYEFHRALHEASGNPLFGQLIRQIQQGFNEIYETPFGQPHLGQASIPLHLGLADAVIANDENAAARITDEIMNLVEQNVREIMETYNG